LLKAKKKYSVNLTGLGRFEKVFLAGFNGTRINGAGAVIGPPNAASSISQKNRQNKCLTSGSAMLKALHVKNNLFIKA